MAQCKQCGDEVVCIETPGKAGKMWWTKYDSKTEQVQFRRSEDGEYITGAILARHRCGKPGERPATPVTPAPPPRDPEQAQGQRDASAAQIDAVPKEPEGFFDDGGGLPF